MASFLENFRQAFEKMPNNQGIVKQDPIAQQKWEKADTSGLESAINKGDIKGTEQNANKEFSTIDKMDRLYRLLSNEFQDIFYDKHFNKETKEWDDVSEKQMTKESTDFMNDVIKTRGLNDETFANGKTFVENFRKYGYDKILLPDIRKDVKYTTGKEKYFPTISPQYIDNTKTNNRLPNLS